MNVSLVETSSPTLSGVADMYRKKSPARSAAKKNPNTTEVRFIVKTSEKKTKHRFSFYFDSSKMDYSILSLPELKVIAKTRRIKHYYILKKQVLIDLIRLAELPQAYILEKRTVKSLREQAKAQGIVRYSKMSRHTLITRLFPQNVGDTTSDENEKNQGKANEHDNPEKDDADHVRVDNVKDAV